MAKQAILKPGHWLVATLLLTLNGCALVPRTPLVQGVTTAEPTPSAPPVVNGSIFQGVAPLNYGYQPLFEDRRPRNIGDTLTITLQENVSASKSSSASANRNGSNSFGVTGVPTGLEGLLGAGGEKAALSAGGKNDFAGKGGATANNTFKQIEINQGTEFIRFSGVVNPRTISASNAVLSTQVADARIEYVGNGYINEAQTMGWFQRFFLNISPM